MAEPTTRPKIEYVIFDMDGEMQSDAIYFIKCYFV